MKTKIPKTLISILKQEIEWAIEDKHNQIKILQKSSGNHEGHYNHSCADYEVIKLGCQIEAYMAVLNYHIKDAQIRYDMEKQKNTPLGKLGITLAKY